MDNEVLIPNLNIPAKTLVDVLEAYALKKPDVVIFKFIDDTGKVESITYRDLTLRAKTIADSLIQHGLKVGDKVILIYAPGLELIATFFGCMYAGVISIPVYPPMNGYLVKKLQNIIEDTNPNFILTSTDLRKKFKALGLIKAINKIPLLKIIIRNYFRKYLDLIAWDFNSVPMLTTDNIVTKNTDHRQLPTISSENLVYLQYTSGSSGIPKGVMNQHSNLLINLRIITKALSLTENDLLVSWLPPYHDMGLIGTILTPIFFSTTTVLMSPMNFIRKPYLWLKTISDYKATISVAPNFSYEYCAKKIIPEQLTSLDLSSMRVLMNGADIIRLGTLDNFYQIFKSCGFKINAFFPCYGLAEASLFVSGDFYKKSIYLSTKELLAHKKKIVSKNDPLAKDFISCGRTELDVQIINPDTKKPSGPNEIGEVWVHGPSISKGYWQREEQSKEIFHAKIADDNSGKEYLRTGDLGFIDQDEIFITGRIKDIIKLNGKNYYPQDFEDSITTSHKKIRAGGVAAISIEVENEERLAVICEIENDTDKNEYQHIVDNICNVIANEYEIPVHAVELIAARSLFKTTSGKISHSAAKYSYIKGQLASKFSWQAPVFFTAIAQENIIKPEAAKTQTQPIEELESIKLWMVNWISAHTHQDIKKISTKNIILKYGLDSISMVQLTQDLSEHLGVEIDPVLAWEHLSIDALAKHIKANQQNFPKIAKPLKIKESLEKQFTFNQIYLLFHQLSHPSDNIYNIGCAFELAGKINFEVFSQACQMLITRHKILSMNISLKDETVFPVYSQDKSIPLEVIDAEQHANESIKKILTQQIMQKILESYDLTRDNLIKLILFRINPEKNIFLVAAHHMVFDGTSMAIFMRELIHIYDRLITNKTPTLAPLILQYPDHAKLQHNNFNEKYLAQQLNYWEKQLDHANTELTFPLDQTRLTNLPVQLSHHNFMLDHDLFSKIRVFCKKLKITPFILLITAYQVALTHYCNQKDMIIGIPVHGRNNSHLKNMIGFFINILPVRFKLDDNETILDLLKKNQKNLQNGYAHQDVSLPELLSRLNIPRDIYDQPLFQTVFIMQNMATSKLSGENFEIKIYLDETGPLPYDLSIEVIPKGKSYRIKLTYNKNLINPSTAKRFAMHFQNAIKICIENLTDYPAKLQLITPEEYDLLINQWNHTAQPYLQNVTLHELFEKQVILSPDKIAIDVDGKKLTYQELNTAANQLAHHLISLGVKPNTIVPICLEKSLELIIGITAIVKAGGAYLPLDEESPESRLREIVMDCKAKILLCSSTTQKIFSNLDINLIALDQLKLGKQKNQTTQNPRIKQNADDLAYVIYTSGTTGKPKGVLISHKAICDHIQWYVNTPINTDVHVNLFSYSFDGSVASLWWPLSKGGTVFTPKSLADFALSSVNKNQEISSIFLTPSMLAILLSANSKNIFAGISDLAVGGEPLPYRLVTEVKKMSPKTRVWNLYGPTEFSVLATYTEVKQCKHSIVPIGKPIANTACYVLNDLLLPVPIGVVGELYVSGIGLAQKYLNRPELTKERFIDNPFKNPFSKLMYKTGDLVRWLPDGNLLYVERNDNQVKIRGFRIELNEIENMILTFGQIKQTVVTTSNPTSNEDKALICYLIVENKKSFEVNALKNHIKNQLPLYMIPNDFVIINEFPLDKNGKIDLKKLPGPTKPKREAININDLSFNQRKLLSLWENVLRQKNIGLQDNFFDLGGNSLSAIKLILSAKIQNLHFTVQDLIKHPTINELADVVQQNEITQSHSIELKDFIVPLNNCSAQKTLFCIHPLGGTVVAYAKLAKMLEPNYAVYGIRSPGIIPNQPLFHSVSDMANYYIEHMKKIQPQGPYTLLGWSLGGLIAYEIAQQLSTSGNVVSTLYSIDTFDPAVIPQIQTLSDLTVLNHMFDLLQANTSGFFDHLISWKAKIVLFGLQYCNPIFSRFLLHYLNSITKADHLDLFSLLKYDLSSEGNASFPIEKLISFLEVNHLIQADTDTNKIAQYYEIFRSNFYAHQTYQIKPYLGEIVSFETKNKYVASTWSITNPNSKTVKLPGTHLDVLRNVDALETIYKGILYGPTRKG